MALRPLPNVATPSAQARADALALADQARLRRYADYLDFYNGRQWVKPRPGRTNLVANYARVIVDKGVSYLLGQGVNFAVPTGDREALTLPLSQGEREQRAAAAEELLYRVYEENELEAVDIQGAINGAVLGDTVFKVFWEERASGIRHQATGDAGTRGHGDTGPSITSTTSTLGRQGDRATGRRGEEGRIRVVNIDPFTFFPRWAEDDPSTLLAVSLVYRLSAEEAALRYGDGETRGRGDAAIEKLSPRLRVSPSPCPVVEEWTDTEFVLTVADREVVRAANPYGFVPFVHIPNARPANEFWGISDLKDVVPLNRELNERMSDVADIIRFHADPPVIFKGVMEHSNLSVGPGTVWDLPEGADVQLLEWRGQTPAIQEHIERVMRALHDVTETPKTAFGDSGRLLSGVALETELQPLIQKTLRKRAWWSAGLRRRNRYILRIAELKGLGSFAPYRSKVIWPPLLPADSEVEVRNNVALVSAGLRSRRTAMDRLGEESPEEEMRLIDEERST